MVWVTVDVGLEEFSDEEIETECRERCLDNVDDDREMLTCIWVHDREGRTSEAYTLMREYVLEKLNKVL